MTQSKSSTNLWPEFPKVKKGTVTILKEQAQWLKKGTDDLIYGLITPFSFESSGEEVETKYSISHLFFIRVPALDDYLYKLFSIRQEGDAHYPLQICPDEDVFKGIEEVLNKTGIDAHGGIILIKDEEQLMKTLKAVFAADRTQEIISNLLGQVQS